jgi:hypothetical protein
MKAPPLPELDELIRPTGAVGKDFTDRDGAAVLKTTIENYWRERGYRVEVLLVAAAFTPALRAARYDLRSHMVNGLPRFKVVVEDA